MLDFTIKSNKTCTKRIPCNSFTIPCERFRMNESTATPATAWEVNSGSLFLQIWQLREDTLNQRLGSFPTKSSAEILPRCRRDYPLLLAINRGWFDGLREEKIGSKVSQKTSLPPSSRCRFSSSVFSSFFLHHRKPTSSPFLPPAPPWATRTTKLCQDHRPATTASVISHRERLSLLCKTFLLPSLSTVAFGHHHSYPEPQFHHIKPAQPPTGHQAATATLSLFSFQPFSLLCNFFFFLPWPTPATITSVVASWATGRTTSSRPRPPRQATSSSLLCLFLPRRGCCMQNSFLHATTKLISSWFGPGQLWPSQSGWLWPCPFL